MSKEEVSLLRRYLLVVRLSYSLPCESFFSSLFLSTELSSSLYINVRTSISWYSESHEVFLCNLSLPCVSASVLSTQSSDRYTPRWLSASSRHQWGSSCRSPPGFNNIWHRVCVSLSNALQSSAVLTRRAEFRLTAARCRSAKRIISWFNRCLNLELIHADSGIKTREKKPSAQIIPECTPFLHCLSTRFHHISRDSSL